LREKKTRQGLQLSGGFKTVFQDIETKTTLTVEAKKLNLQKKLKVLRHVLARLQRKNRANSDRIEGTKG